MVMAAFSLSTVWEETIAFMRRELALLLPVALALFGAAQILFQIAMLAMSTNLAKPDPTGPQALLVIPSILLILFGNLTITRLALVPGTSVAEALGVGFRRLPVALASCFLLGFALSAAMMVILVAATLGAMNSGVDPKTGASGGLTLTVLIPAVIVFVRFLMLMPALAMEKDGAIATIRRAWNLGRGNGLRFFGVFLLGLAANLAVTTLNIIVIGSLAGLLRFVIGNELVTVLQLIVSGALGAMLMLGLAVYTALVYRKLAAP